MKSFPLLSLASVLLLAGCENAPDQSLLIQFPEGFVRQGAYTLTLSSIVPGQDAACEPLNEGRARPRDPAYTVEQEESIPLDGKDSPPALHPRGPGPRLFFGELTGEDEPGQVLRGCARVERDGREDREIPFPLKRIMIMALDEVVTYTLIARHSGKCADVSAGSPEDGERLVQSTCDGRASERFSLKVAEPGYFWLISGSSGKAIEVRGPSQSNGAAIQQGALVEGDHQKWKQIPAGPGFYKLACKHSGKLMAVPFFSRRDGVDLIQWADIDAPNQHWALTRQP